jgi:hypothetical protein
MELNYTVDEAAQVVHASVAGPFERDMFLEMLERMCADGTWTFGTLLDIRAMTGVPSFDSLRHIADAATRPGRDHQRRGPLAILTTDPAHFGMACTYAALSKGRDIDVFSDPSDADLWLLMRVPHATW